MYDGRLHAEAHCVTQRVDSSGLSGTGLRMVSVEHLGNRGRSPEEADEIAKAVTSLLADGTFTDRDRVTRALSPRTFSWSHPTTRRSDA